MRDGRCPAYRHRVRRVSGRGLARTRRDERRLPRRERPTRKQGRAEADSPRNSRTTRASGSGSSASRGRPRRSITPTSSRSTTPATRKASSTSRCGTSRATSRQLLSREGPLSLAKTPFGRRPGRKRARRRPRPRPASPRREASEHPARRCIRAGGVPHRVPGRLRSDEAPRVAQRDHRVGPVRRDDRLHVAGADRGPRSGRADRHLLARLRCLRVSGRARLPSGARPRWPCCGRTCGTSRRRSDRGAVRSCRRGRRRPCEGGGEVGRRSATRPAPTSQPISGPRSRGRRPTSHALSRRLLTRTGLVPGRRLQPYVRAARASFFHWRSSCAGSRRRAGRLRLRARIREPGTRFVEVASGRAPLDRTLLALVPAPIQGSCEAKERLTADFESSLVCRLGGRSSRAWNTTRRSRARRWPSTSSAVFLARRSFSPANCSGRCAIAACLRPWGTGVAPRRVRGTSRFRVTNRRTEGSSATGAAAGRRSSGPTETMTSTQSLTGRIWAVSTTGGSAGRGRCRPTSPRPAPARWPSHTAPRSRPGGSRSPRPRQEST